VLRARRAVPEAGRRRPARADLRFHSSSRMKPRWLVFALTLPTEDVLFVQYTVPTIIMSRQCDQHSKARARPPAPRAASRPHGQGHCAACIHALPLSNSKCHSLCCSGESAPEQPALRCLPPARAGSARCLHPCFSSYYCSNCCVLGDSGERAPEALQGSASAQQRCGACERRCAPAWQPRWQGACREDERARHATRAAAAATGA